MNLRALDSRSRSPDLESHFIINVVFLSTWDRIICITYLLHGWVGQVGGYGSGFGWFCMVGRGYVLNVGRGYVINVGRGYVIQHNELINE